MIKRVDDLREREVMLRALIFFFSESGNYFSNTVKPEAYFYHKIL